MEKAIFKYNNSACAILCSKCKTIIKTGREFNEKETLAFRGEDILEAQYCTTCLPIKIKEEVVNGYNIMNLARESAVDNNYDIEDDVYKHGYYKGFKAHEELVKDKMFTVEDVKLLAIELIARYKLGEIKEVGDVQKIIDSRLPKTEWNIVIDENNKIKLCD